MKSLSLVLANGLMLAGAVAAAAPSVAPFYQQAAQIQPLGRLGQIVKQEQIATQIPGAEAWKIAYISSDVNDKRTIATALVVAPRGAGVDRPVLAWAHGTRELPKTMALRKKKTLAVPLNEYYHQFEEKAL